MVWDHLYLYSNIILKGYPIAHSLCRIEIFINCSNFPTTKLINTTYKMNYFRVAKINSSTLGIRIECYVISWVGRDHFKSRYVNCKYYMIFIKYLWCQL